ncbi:MAG: hypothetical protein MSG64_01540 [Pyrinomonadaceae bacterium MAG19_C2-C3]|nr:hypothetical protein [Pyrinomonadaceae bacterium MAG19_C2-C3]
MKNEIDVMRDLASKFAVAHIDYMLTGSVAMNFYAQPRMTRDIDIVVELSVQDIGKVIAAYTSEYYVVRESVERAVARRSIFNMIHNESVIKVDCIIRKNEIYRRAEFARRKQVTISDFTIWIVSREDLIISKLVWAKDSHSEMQLRDVKNLLMGGYDESYINKWTTELGLDEVWRKAKA